MSLRSHFIQKTSAVLVLLMTLVSPTAQAALGGNFGPGQVALNGPAISNAKALPLSINPSNGEQTIISFDISQDAYTTVEIYKNNGATKVDTLINKLYLLKGVGYQVIWNGKDPVTHVPVAVGAYQFKITLSQSANGSASDTFLSSGNADIQVVGAGDVTPPVLAVVSPVATPTFDNTPDFTFSANEAGTIVYGGSCVSNTSAAVAGNNLVTFNFLPAGTYSNCQIQVRDAANNISLPLVVPSFTIQSNVIDLIAPVLAVVTPVVTPTFDNTPDFTFSSNEAGTIVYGGSCVSNTSVAVAGNNLVTFNFLPAGTYSNCQIQVRDASNNTSAALVVPSFTIQGSNADVTAPVLSVVTPVQNPTFDTTPDFTFSSNEAGTIIYSGSCFSNTTSAVAGNNLVTFNTLSAGTYSNCQIQVRDAANNTSALLTVPTFTIQGNVNSAPVVYSVSASPTSFNPYNNELTTITYYIDKAATSATVQILDSSNVSRITINGNTFVNQANTVVWNGRDANNNILPTGNYTILVTASNGLAGTGYGSVSINNTVNSCGNSSGSVVLSNVTTSPTSFNPSSNELTTIYYNVDRSALVTVEVLSGNSLIRTLLSDVCQLYQSTNYYVTWNGRDLYNNIVANGSYTIRVQSHTSNGTVDVKYAYVQVGNSSSNSNDVIGNFVVAPDTFNPNKTQSVVYYSLNKSATVTTEVLDRNNNVIRTIVSGLYRTTGTAIYSTTYGTYTYADVWNGRDRNNNMVKDDIYQIRVRATTSNNESETQTAWVEVDTDNILVGFPTSSTCAGFKDVAVTGPYCKAIEELKKLNIVGYADGSFRPYQLLTRAEAGKVIALAMKMSVSNDSTYLGWTDIDTTAWYIPYLKTLKKNGIWKGYSDHTFRPLQTIRRIELAKVFEEAAAYMYPNFTIPYCAYAPYIDTPVTTETRWYIDYACKARSAGLMPDDGTGRFNPGSPMTRGDLADLFYQFESRGLNK